MCGLAVKRRIYVRAVSGYQTMESDRKQWRNPVQRNVKCQIGLRLVSLKCQSDVGSDPVGRGRYRRATRRAWRRVWPVTEMVALDATVAEEVVEVLWKSQLSSTIRRLPIRNRQLTKWRNSLRKAALKLPDRPFLIWLITSDYLFNLSVSVKWLTWMRSVVA